MWFPDFMRIKSYTAMSPEMEVQGHGGKTDTVVDGVSLGVRDLLVTSSRHVDLWIRGVSR